MTHTAYIALGSNLGDRERMLAEARRRLHELPGTRVLAISAVHETAPIGGPPGQRKYLNAALKIETDLPPRALLAECLAIEQALGRVRTVPNAPRTIDIDILLYDDLVLRTPELQIPHPRMHDRAFVLAPLAELAADLVHPTIGVSVAKLLASCNEAGPAR